MYHFDKSRRLLTKRDFDFVFSQAKKVATPHFIVLYRANTSTQARLGFALSKKAVAKAHDRNRIKRLFREAFRQLDQLPAIDMIVLAKPGIAKIENDKLMEQLNSVWNRL